MGLFFIFVVDFAGSLRDGYPPTRPASIIDTSPSDGRVNNTFHVIRNLGIRLLKARAPYCARVYRDFASPMLVVVSTCTASSHLCNVLTLKARFFLSSFFVECSSLDAKRYVALSRRHSSCTSPDTFSAL